MVGEGAEGGWKVIRPLAFDLFCGLGGWAEGLLLEGYDVIGFDIERHVYGEHRYPAQLVLQDVMTLCGSQLRLADLIVASPPCQEYSYRAMPWKRAKALPPPSNKLFNVCFQLQLEACAAAGRHIPLVVENVCGAQKWVGRARAHYGSYYLWGDVPALMPITTRGYKSSGMNWSDPTKRGQDFTRIAGNQAIKNSGGSWFRVAHNTTSGKGQNPDVRPPHTPHMTNPAEHDVKLGGTWFHDYRAGQGPRNYNSKSSKRKFASAMIAKIPLELSTYIARTFYPRQQVVA